MIKIPEDIQTVFEEASCIYSKEAVEKALDKMALEITEAVSDAYPIFLCVVVGGMIPFGSLLTRMFFPLEINYIHASRYTGTVGGELVWKAKPSCSLQGRTIVIVDDILDSGLTLCEIIKFCEAEKAKKIYTSVLVDKHHAREPQGLQKADFTGLTVDGYQYVFGYGMDYRGYLRNAPGIFAIHPDHH